ncbi:MAG: RdgB/HAM1 family non-canonical purine NTP pyrophosphatase [Promethearchaeota archaeon]|nr:MAG: RdgB/HAM1 family non-canonical purine NTP pyrophosphatase [Candidatus Lokiarchaeota archaeon]
MSKDQNILYFISGNVHKYNEILNLFRKENLKYILKQKNTTTVEIQARSIKEVALYKLESIKGQIDGSYFIEDAGFFVDTPLDGFPGVYSSYVMKTIGNKGILRLIDNFDETRAHFTSVIALYFKPLDKNLFFEGTIYGKVSKTLRGSGGFGFDPIFLPNVIPNKTFAELTTEEKNKISHRGQAWRKLIKFLRENTY